jgi:hypothetical protein
MHIACESMKHFMWSTHHLTLHKKVKHYFVSIVRGNNWDIISGMSAVQEPTFHFSKSQFFPFTRVNRPKTT